MSELFDIAPQSRRTASVPSASTSMRRDSRPPSVPPLAATVRGTPDPWPALTEYPAPASSMPEPARVSVGAS